MPKYIFYACTGEESVRYACEHIMLHKPITASTSTASLLAESEVIAFSDRASEIWGTLYYGLPVIPPHELVNQEVDYIYILSAMSHEAIYNDLTSKYNIPSDKIIIEPMRLYNLTRTRFVQTIAENLSKRGIRGSVAEGGVYRGNFAKVINANFPDSKLYLFDTFGGFDDRDTKSDAMFAISANTHSHLSNTSIDIVRKKLPHADKAVFCKGYFPETTTGIDEDFIFVNLDFDLYMPIKAGLEFFYPKMTGGGNIGSRLFQQ